MKNHAILQESLGISAPIALVHAIMEWVEAHTHAFHNVASCATILDGGLVRNLTSPHALVFLLGLPLADPRGNPSRKFRLLRTTVVPKEDLGRALGGDDWDAWEKERARHVEMLRRVPHSKFAGVLRAVFVLEDAPGVFSYNWYPVYRVNLRNTNEVAPAARPVLQDLFDICTASINAGLLFRFERDGPRVSRFYPELGTLELRGKKWVWCLQPESTWDALVDDMKASGCENHTGLDPRSVFVRLYTDRGL
ncbi:hypothetical protein OH77DRAFT_1431226 [Trametes cingulata]|nr:hypothetical protein OH77DRAFT_1431226 [Trametes cingulata]